MDKLIGYLLATSLWLLSASTKSGKTRVDAEPVAAGTPHSPGMARRPIGAIGKSKKASNKRGRYDVEREFDLTA